MSAIIFGIRGFELTPQEKEWLKNPNSVGIILFTRNYENLNQIQKLCASIYEIAPEKLICVDHEGGRVQRFRKDFTALPSFKKIGDFYEKNPEKALKIAENVGIIVGSELHFLDFSFTPVLDLFDAQSRVINERAFSADPSITSALAWALRQGLRQAGCGAVGKHYSGHGSIQADSHHEMCRDFRDLVQRNWDKQVFLDHIASGIEAIMPAHIIYPESNGLPAGFSPVLMQELRAIFDGAIISDDLDMAGAHCVGNTYVERVQQALSAGVDTTLICNQFEEIEKALSANYVINEKSASRLKKLKRQKLPDQALYQQALQEFQKWQAN